MNGYLGKSEGNHGAANSVMRLVFQLAFASLLSFAVLYGSPSAAWAQQGPTDLPPEKAQELMKLLADPEVKAWLQSKTPPPAKEPESSAIEAISGWEAAIRTRIGGITAAMGRVPEEFAKAAAVLSADKDSARPWPLVLTLFAAVIAAGAGAEALVRRSLRRGGIEEARQGAWRDAVPHLLSLLTFVMVSAGLFMAIEWPPLLRRAILTLLLALIAFRAIRILARLLIALAAPEDARVSVGTIELDPKVRFWLQRLDRLAGLFLFGWAIVALMPGLGFSREMTQFTALLFGFGLLAIGIQAVWTRPDQRTSVIQGVLLTIYLVALWLAWLAGLLGLLWLGIFALLLPATLRGVDRLAHSLATRVKVGGALGVVLDVLIVRGARALVLAAAVAWLAYIWRLRAAAIAGSPAGTAIVSGILNGIVILLMADLLWQLSKALIAYRLDVEAGATPDEIARTGRLRTLLPIFRNTLAAFIATIAVLTILSGLGVQIGPLIAGAGVLGVAIGFGAQTLVKDVLSGVFYMLDDAFRVGEYIQSGSYKGTVESFSLRSVRLRHHRGPVFTVPFGELGAVQNMSRDWVIDKMTINVTYDSDVELARKIIKKIGLELAEDPEFAADTLQPLKMQGVETFGDFAIVLRIKLMTKPNAQFGIKRKALVMIKKAFDENGIKIAVPTVHVEGGSENAAAAQQMLRANAAANQA
ncbi:mechanosensitive ion channel family protein [Pseudaminobacter soli (ex Zhang et al. 2022)]|nr:mechanosensitive ion channel family protein [Pseudaminobacter soli]